MPAQSFLSTLELAAQQAAKAEEDFRREVAERARRVEQERAFAHRRLNVMRAIADTIVSAESEEAAIGAATAVLRTKLGWAADSDARKDVLSRFVPVARRLFLSLSVRDDGRMTAGTDVAGALADFEAWYSSTHPNPFWILFEHYMPETPLVDF